MMKKFCQTLCLSSLLLWSVQVFALSEEQKMQYRLLAVAKLDAYINSAHCDPEIRNFFVVEEKDDHLYYIFLVGLDEGCGQGSGSYKDMLLSVVSFGNLKKMRVAEDIIDEYTPSEFRHRGQTIDFSYRFIEDVKIHNARYLSFTTYAHQKNDAQNFPSLMYRVQLDLENKDAIRVEFLGIREWW